MLNVTEELERLIDASDLTRVLTGLEIVCGEKAGQWQDKASARAWDHASRVCGRAAREIKV